MGHCMMIRPVQRPTAEVYFFLDEEDLLSLLPEEDDPLVLLDGLSAAAGAAGAGVAGALPSAAGLASLVDEPPPLSALAALL